MAIGKLVSIPPPGSQWAQVRDEYGNQWTVQDSELPKGAKAGDEFAYRVDFSQQLAPRLQKID